MAYYASVIIDISHEKLDRTFQYKIPEELFSQIYRAFWFSFRLESETVSFGDLSLK